MPQTLRKRTISAIAASLVILSLAAIVFAPAVRAAEAAPASVIRVALLISTRGTSPVATLQSASAMAVIDPASSGSFPDVSVEAGRQVRFSLSGYSLIVRETEDYGVALEAYRNAAPFGFALISADTLRGRTVYQVRLAGYASRSEAVAVAGRVPGMQGGTPAVAGPLFASVGTFASADDAESFKNALQQAGIRAWVAVHRDVQGFGFHSVWIGESATGAELEKAMADAAALYPGIVPNPVDGSTPFLLRQTDLLPDTNAAIPHYRMNGNGHEIRVQGTEGSVIKLAERYGRSYRGSMILTAYEGKLAVINELPLEQYLYSVVSSEMPSSWPIEALKAQAVAARTYALKQGWKYRIAQVSDTTYDQAYHGVEAESAKAIEAVEATRGEVIRNATGLIEPFYASNHGGRSADPVEVWSGDAPYAKIVTSPDDVAQRGKLDWYRIMLSDGTSGYIRSDFAVLTGEKSKSGLPVIEVTGSNVNIRRAPRVDNTDNPAIALGQAGERYVVIGQDTESNAYNWIRGPYSADTLKSTLNARADSAVQGTLTSLEVTARGPSGRVTEISANGKPVRLSYPDLYRSALNGLPSTNFSIEETGRYTVLAAFGAKREFPETGGSLSVLSAEGTVNLSQSEFYVMNGNGDIRAVTKEPAFRFVGYGFGHGLGLSQYGAMALAESGYDYQAILKYYYDGISIVKE